MPSQTTLIWAGAAGLALVAAGAGAALWTYPNLIWTPLAPVVVAEAPPPATSAPPPIAQPAPVAPAERAPAAAPAVKPAFDAVNVDPTGAAVIAGRAAPNAKVELRDAGKTLAEATADASGQFVMIPPPLAPGAHNLSLSSIAGDAAPATSNVVDISVPPPEQEAKAAPAAPIRAPPPASPAPAARMLTLATSPQPEAARVAIRSVEAGADGALVAKGSAEPNALVRLYLNGVNLADAKTRGDGLWSLTIRRGVAGGAYVVRADEINPPDAKVVATAEMRFDFPASLASGAEPGKPAAAPSAPLTAPIAPSPSGPAELASKASPADAIVDSVQTAQVTPGHTLWSLSQSYYGDPTRYPLIYEANKAEIHNPNLIYPGQVFVVPKFETKQP